MRWNMPNELHHGPHCAGLCEGAAYVTMLRQKDARIAELEQILDEARILSELLVASVKRLAFSAEGGG